MKNMQVLIKSFQKPFCYRVFYWTIFGFLLLLQACDQAAKPVADVTIAPHDLGFRPNIVWLVAEDLSPYIPSFGDSTVQTPNLDRLAAQGVRYTNTYSVAGVCAPSRFTLATGMYTTSAGAQHMRTLYHHDFMEQMGLKVYEVVPPPAVKMMSQVLRENGYYCTNNDKTDYQMNPSLMAWDESSPYAHWRNRAPGQQFFSIFNFNITHESQVFGPSGRINLRYTKDFPHPPGTYKEPEWRGSLDSSEWKLFVSEDLEVEVPPYLVDSEPTRNDIRRVYSNIVKMDEQVGVLLDQLEADGLLDSTIIVWYTDHGGPLPRQKRLLYDSGLKVPMIIRYPTAWQAGAIDDQLISFVDFAPTAFSMAGIEPPAYLEGQAFVGKYKTPKERDYIFGAADRLDTERDMIRAVRDKRYKYLRNFHPEQGYYLAVKYRENMRSMQELLRLRDSGGLNEYQAQWFRQSKPEEELFDTQNDPHELHNLAGDPAHADKLKELREACNQWMVATNDKGLMDEGDLLESFWPNREQPQTAAVDIQEADGKVRLSCPTPGAAIGYKLFSGTEKPDAWIPYTGPISVPEGAELEVVAHRLGYKPSEVQQVH